MWLLAAEGIALPFICTSIGAAGVFFMRGKGMPRRIIIAVAAGIMTAAAFFSLILPALEYSSELDAFAFLPASLGFAAGMMFLPAADALLRRMAGDGAKLGAVGKLALAVTLHNLPEGMAVGAAFALCLCGGAGSPAGAFALALGIALQDLPEGAIISMPLHSDGMGRTKAFAYGALSGAVEPIGALLVLSASRLFLPLLPYTLSFAAGAMFCVVLDELAPEIAEGGSAAHAAFAFGFVLMMALDLAFAE